MFFFKITDLANNSLGYSGVAVYTRNTKCQPIKAEEGITGIMEPVNSPGMSYKSLPPSESIGGYPDLPRDEAVLLDSEGRALVIDFGAFVLIGTYCPAATDPERDDFRISYVETLFQRTRNLIEMGRRVVIMGDLNISRNEIDSAEAAARMNAMRAEGYERWIDTPTRGALDRLLKPNPEGVMVDLCREYWPDRTGMFTCEQPKIPGLGILILIWRRLEHQAQQASRKCWRSHRLRPGFFKHERLVL